MRITTQILIGVMFILAFVSSASASKKVALVIGNSQYNHVAQLANPANDADDISVSLENIGFDVTKVKDLGYQQMRLTLRRFGRKALGSDIALIYYAGHGIEVDNNNYLIPTDAKLETDIDVEFEAMPLDNLNRAVAGAKNLRLILLDACRDNPFAKSMTRSISTRSIGRGLARIEPTVGTLVSYAAKEGTVAADGKGRNSPYSKALIKHLDEQGLEIQFMFRKVRDSVIASTNGKQEPFTYGSLPGNRIFLNPKEKQLKPEVKVENPKAAPESESTAEIAFWESIKNGENQGYFQAYLNRYPSGVFSELAKIKIAEIQKSVSGAKIETQLNNGRAPQEVEEINIAAIDPQQTVPIAELEPEVTQDPKKDRQLVRGIQRELNRVGCSAGKADGIWGKGSARALRNYRTHGKVKLPSLNPSANLLDQLKTKKSRVCPLTCRKGFEVSKGRCKRIVKKAAVNPKPKSSTKTNVQRQNVNRSRNSSQRVDANQQCGICGQDAVSDGTILSRFCGREYILRKGRGLCK